MEQNYTEGGLLWTTKSLSQIDVAKNEKTYSILFPTCVLCSIGIKSS